MSNVSTLTGMQRTGREISDIFNHVMSEDEKSRIATLLLALMRSTTTNHPSRLMVLGALAAVGREAQETA